MALLTSYFNDFMSEIRLTPSQTNDLITGHRTLRKRLDADEDLSEIIVTTFLQGSYRRSTAVRPKNRKRSDVDVVVVTNLDKDKYTPQQAHDLFIPFLEKHYKDKYRIQGRSLGIELTYVDLDLVVTAAPSEAQKALLTNESIQKSFSIDDLITVSSNHHLFTQDVINEGYTFFNKLSEEPAWKLEPLLIPNRDAEQWEPTDPLAQIRWTWEKNKLCNKHYVNVVKALKWWRRVDDILSTHPKGYPLEHLIGQCCPDNINSIAEGITLTLENIIKEFPSKPTMPDHGVPEHDVFERLTEDEYNSFYERVQKAAAIARQAFDLESVYDSANKWRELLGDKFPKPPENSNKKSNFTPRTEPTTIGGNRFA